VRSCWEDEPVDEILLNIFQLLLLLKERGWTTDLFDAYYIRLAQQRTGLRETAQSRTHWWITLAHRLTTSKFALSNLSFATLNHFLQDFKEAFNAIYSLGILWANMKIGMVGKIMIIFDRASAELKVKELRRP
jgi:hypothetical protein